MLLTRTRVILFFVLVLFKILLYSDTLSYYAIKKKLSKFTVELLTLSTKNIKSKKNKNNNLSFFNKKTKKKDLINYKNQNIITNAF